MLFLYLLFPKLIFNKSAYSSNFFLNSALSINDNQYNMLMPNIVPVTIDMYLDLSLLC